MTDLPVTSTLDIPSRGGPAGSIQLLLAVNTTTLDVPSRGGPAIGLEVPLSVGASLTITGPGGATTIPSSHSGVITLDIVGSGTSLSGSTVYVLSGAGSVGAAISATRNTDGTNGQIDITTASAVGPLTVTETVTGSAAGVITIAAATLAITETPIAAATGSVLLHLTGVNTFWTIDSPVYTLGGGVGGVKSAQNILSNTTATLTLTTGTLAGTLSVTDPSTQAVGTTVQAEISFVSTLRGYWAMEESGNNPRLDSSGNGNTLTATNMARAAGKQGFASDHVFANDPGLIRSGASATSLAVTDGPFTLWGWAKFNDLVDIHSLMGKLIFSLQDGEEYWVAYPGTGVSALYIKFSMGNNSHAGIGDGPVASDKVIQAAVWYCWFAAFDGVSLQTLQVYDEGGSLGLVWPQTLASILLDRTHDFTIGSVETTHDYMAGQIDETGVAAKVLSQNERLWLINAGTGRTYAEIAAAGQDSSGGPSTGGTAELLLLGIL